jgi:hypothetical protein
MADPTCDCGGEHPCAYCPQPIVIPALPEATGGVSPEMLAKVNRYGKGCWCFGADHTESNAKDAKHHEDALLSAIRRLEEDAARLTWIEKNGREIMEFNGLWHILFFDDTEATASTLRRAIDIAADA